jgi:hypothetical protein
MLLLRFVMRRLVFRMLTSCGFLLSWLHVLWLLVLQLPYHRLLLQLLRLLLVVRVLILIVIIVVGMDTWRLSIGRRKLRRLRLTVLHRVLVVLVLQDLRGVLLVQRHMSCSCYFVALRPLRRQELLALWLSPLHLQVLLLLLSLPLWDHLLLLLQVLIPDISILVLPSIWLLILLIFLLYILLTDIALFIPLMDLLFLLWDRACFVLTFFMSLMFLLFPI